MMTWGLLTCDTKHMTIPEIARQFVVMYSVREYFTYAPPQFILFSICDCYTPSHGKGFFTMQSSECNFLATKKCFTS